VAMAVERVAAEKGQDCSLSHVCNKDAAVLIKRNAKDAPQNIDAL